MDRRGFLGSVIGTVVAGLGLGDVAAAGAPRRDFVARPPGPYTVLTPLERLEAAVRLMRGGDALRRACRGIWFAGDPGDPADPAIEFLTPGWKTTAFDADALSLHFGGTQLAVNRSLVITGFGLLDDRNRLLARRSTRKYLVAGDSAIATYDLVLGTWPMDDLTTPPAAT